ncbi:MAG: TSUP family transporter [Alphaproteobacteria bacterium]
MASGSELSPNTMAFCVRPWQPFAAALAVLVFATFAWGFYILDHFKEDTVFSGIDDLSITAFLFRDVASPPDAQRLLDVVPPAVVGISGRGVNSSVVASGAIVGANGYVLTTLHSVTPLPDIDVHVRTSTGVRRYQAQVVKSEPAHDLALLKMRTTDRFLFFVIGDAQGLSATAPVFGFGHGLRGNTVFRAGRIVGSNVSLMADGGPISNLLASDAIYAWEQNGGPLVNANGELIGIGIALTGPTGQIQGYAVPSQVISTHFQDVVKFKQAPVAAVADVAAVAAAAPAGVPVMPYAAPVAMAPPGVPSSGVSPVADAPGSASWWAMARAQVARENETLGVNVAVPNGPAPNGPVPNVAVPGVGTAPAPTVPPVAARPGVTPPSPAMVPSPAAPRVAPVRPIFSVPNVDPDHGFGVTIGGYQIGNILGLAALALVAGIVGGMMTMGGGVVQVAGMMVFFGYGMYLIRPVAYLTNVFVYGAAALRNDRSGLVVWENVRALAPWGVAGVVIGYFIGNAIDDTIVAIVLGVFAMLMAMKGLHEIFYDRKDEEILVARGVGTRKPAASGLDVDALFDETRQRHPRPEPRLDHVHNAGLGLPMGLISGILGISGGVVEVPLQRFFGGMSLQNAIANSSVLVFWASVGGAAVAFIHGITTGLIDWQAPLSLALIMIPGAYVGGLIGAQVMKVLPQIALKWIYTAIMLATSIKLLSVS